MSLPASFNRRETEEYDHRRASFSSARSSYVGSSSSSGTGFLPVKREWSDEEEELEALEWRQAVADNVTANKKADEWRRIRAEQAAKYIDLCSSSEED